MYSEITADAVVNEVVRADDFELEWVIACLFDLQREGKLCIEERDALVTGFLEDS